LDINTGDFVFSGIDLGDEDVGVASQSLGSFFVVWDEGLAMSAPWGVELDQDFFIAVKNQFLEGLSDNDLDWGVV